MTREPHPERYIAAIRSTGAAPWRREELAATDLLREAWMLGLRLAEGVAIARLAELGDPETRWRPLLQPLLDLDLVAVADGRIRLTDASRHIQDGVTVRLMP